MPVLQTGLAKSAAEDYTIDQSLRFDDGDSAKLERELASGDTTAWTFSCWVKRGNFAGSGNSMKIFGAYGDSSNISDINFNEEYIDVSEYVGGSTVGRLKTNALYRDTASWYQITVVWDSDNVTSGDRYRLYVNGDRVTSFSTETQPSSAQASCTNSNADHRFGQQNSDEYFDGYLAEVYFIDGTALDASSFGETDTATGQWKPIDASDLTFGTNGFYQKYSSTELAASFEDSSKMEQTFTPTETLSVDVLLVGGGGGGQSGFGGGGGAGGIWHGTSHSVTAQDYSVVVGTGGQGGSAAGSSSAAGGNTTFDSKIGYGGGGTTSDRSGGSGQGAGEFGGAGTSTQTDQGGTGYGNAGGTQYSSGSNDNPGGGGGASAVGENGSSSKAGDGGAGQAFTITGASVTYGGGGGGGSRISADDEGAGGAGGGGAGAGDASETAGNGTDGLGGGGGGGGQDAGAGPQPASAGGNGGSGIAIIRYVSTTAKASGGTITSYVDGGTTYQVHSFTYAHDAHTITANGDVTNTRAQSKVGDSSIYFDGTGDYLSIADSDDFDFSSAFTLEGWWRFDTTSTQTLYVKRASNIADNIKLGVNVSAGKWALYISSNGSSWDIVSDDSISSVSTNTWYHVALTWSGAEYNLWIDGTAVKTVTSSSAPNVNTASLYFGCEEDGSSNPVNGYADEIRISDTCRYDSTFTTFGQDGGTIASPTPFTADSNTLLLIHSDFDGGLGADSSGNENDFSVTNLVAQIRWLIVPRITLLR